MYFWQCARTWSLSHSGQRERTANATLPSTVSHGINAWPWKITARSRLGPRISRPPTNT